MANPPDKQTRIFLWCWPRTISTCLEKCLSFVEGVQTWHEPYHVAFNRDLITRMNQLNVGGQAEVMMNNYIESVACFQNQPNEFADGRFMPTANFTYPWVKSQLEEEEPGKKYILVKDTAYSIYRNLDALPDVPSRHTFIVRHPYLHMTSGKKMFMRANKYEGDPREYVMPPEVANEFYGEDYVYLLWKHFKDTGKEPNPVIIDAEDLMNYPENILKKYLEALGIPFRESYVTWDASEESLKTWKGAMEYTVLHKRMGTFDKAFRSSQFLPNTHAMPKEDDLTPDIKGIIDRIMPGYKEMYKHRIKPE